MAVDAVSKPEAIAAAAVAAAVQSSGVEQGSSAGQPEHPSGW
jgi:hypothetical protein